MNPFLKHPILQFVGYEMMKKPTLDGIKADLQKLINKPKLIYIALFSLFFSLYGIYKILMSDAIIDGVIYLIIGVGWIFISKFEKKKKEKRYAISDEEILEQIDINKEWNSDKS